MTDAPSDSDNLVLLRDALAPLWEEARDMAELKRRLGRPASRELAWLRPVMVAGAAVYREGESWRCEILVEGGPSGRGRLAPNARPGGREAALTLLLGMLCDACLGAVADVSEDAATAPACERANSEPPEHPGPHAEAVPAAATASAAPQVFEYDGLALPLSGRTVRTLRETGVDVIDARYVRRRLDEVRRDLAKGAVLTPELVEALGPDARRGLLMVCTMAALIGIPRWPEPGARAA